MTIEEDVLWIAIIAIYVYLAAFLLPLILSYFVLFVSGSLTLKWIYASGLPLIVIGNYVVFLPMLYFLKREGAE